MSYTPPVAPQEVAPAIKKFQFFLFCAFIILVLMILSMTYPTTKPFWKDKVLWSFGSYLTLISVLHTRFFDIKKNANRGNRRFDWANVPLDEFKLWFKLENIINVLWVVGALLLVASKWAE